jgi:hypothetical protein
MAQNVRETLNSILEAFESGKIPEAIAHSMFPIPDLPSSNWSVLNRIIMFLSGTADARGFRQWNDAGRHVKKGARAIYILVPRMIKRETASETGEPDEEEVLAGFMGRPVFRVEDTDGEPLDYEQIELPPLPLMERAKEWGLSVKAVPGNYQYHGYFAQDKQEIGHARSTRSPSHWTAQTANTVKESRYNTCNRASQKRSPITAAISHFSSMKLIISGLIPTLFT